MRRLLLLIAALLLTSSLSAQNSQNSNASGDIAHGSEKVAHQVAHPKEGHGEGAEAPKTYLGIPGWILKLANMLLFIGVLVYFVGGPVKKTFIERGEGILRAADEARERHAKADRMAADIEARLKQIEVDVRTIRDRAEADGRRQREELIAAAEAEAAKILQSARNEVENRLKHARQELTEYAGQLASDRAEAILRDKITEADQQKLFRESLAQVGEVRS